MRRVRESCGQMKPNPKTKQKSNACLSEVIKGLEHEYHQTHAQCATNLNNAAQFSEDALRQTKVSVAHHIPPLSCGSQITLVMGVVNKGSRAKALCVNFCLQIGADLDSLARKREQIARLTSLLQK